MDNYYDEFPDAVRAIMAAHPDTSVSGFTITQEIFDEDEPMYYLRFVDNTGYVLNFSASTPGGIYVSEAHEDKAVRIATRYREAILDELGRYIFNHPNAYKDEDPHMDLIQWRVFEIIEELRWLNYQTPELCKTSAFCGYLRNLITPARERGKLTGL